MPKNYWLVKQEPEAYSWATFVQEGRVAWTGIRNFQARNNLRAMKKGDLVFFYHSVSEKQVVGVACVEKEAYADSTATEGDWSSVDLVPLKALRLPVTLQAIKADQTLKDILLVRNSRLSVSPLNEAQFKRVLALAETISYCMLTAESLSEKWVGRATCPPRSATCRPEWPRISQRNQRQDCSSTSHPFRPASCRTAQAGSLCYPNQQLSMALTV